MDVQKQYPFETVAVCMLPNHIHAIWTLPPDDADYSLRWRLIKTKFSAHFQERTVAALNEAAQALVKENKGPLKGIILDLRETPHEHPQ